MNRGRLCWFAKEDKGFKQESRDMFEHFKKNKDLLQQTVLERDEETQDMVIAFLDTLPL